MSRSYTTTKMIPRSFFPAKPGEVMRLKKMKLTAEHDSKDPKDWESSIALTDGTDYVWVYFDNGFVSFFDMNFASAWAGGEKLMAAIRGAYRGKF